MLLDTIESAAESARGLAFEIIVVDDQSTDGSCDRLPLSVGRIRSNKRLGCSGSRYLGAKYAIGDVIMLTDSHCVFPLGVVSGLYKEAYARDDAILSVRVILEKKGLSLGGVASMSKVGVKEHRTSRQAHNPVLIGSIYLMSRPVYEAMRELPELPGYWGHCEMWYSTLAYRRGLRVVVPSHAPCVHRVSHGRKTLPYPLPPHHRMMNAHYYHACCFPESYDSKLKPILEKHSPGSSRHLVRDDRFNKLSQWLMEGPVSEQWFLHNVVRGGARL